MPCPRSSISLSIASVRPSTLATPSPTSRMMPTFCLLDVPLASLICASISCNRSVIFPSPRSTGPQDRKAHRDLLRSKLSLQRLQTLAHAPVIDITAYPDPHSSDQCRAERERSAYPGSI